MVIYTFSDLARIFGYGYFAGVLSLPVGLLIASSLGRGKRGE